LDLSGAVLIGGDFGGLLLWFTFGHKKIYSQVQSARPCRMFRKLV
jgi:hypothetical protein